MNRLLKTLLLISLPTSLFGATPVTFTGTIQTATGGIATSGYVEFDLTPQNGAIAYSIVGTALIAPQSGRCAINSSGQVVNLSLSGPCLLWGNDIITPANSLYKIIVAPFNKITNTYNNVFLSGTTVDLSNLTFIAPSPVVGQQLNFSPLVTQTLAPGLDSVFTLGQVGKNYASTYTNSVTGRDIPTPSRPGSGEIGYFKANSGWCSLDSSGIERCLGAPPTPISCSTLGAVVIQSPSGTTFVCDSFIIADGLGSLSLVNLTASGAIIGASVGTTGPGGVLDLVLQATPSNVPSNHIYFYGDTFTGFVHCRNSAGADCLNALQFIVSGSITLPATLVTAGGCNTYTSTATGATSSNSVFPSVHGVNVSSVSGYGPGQLEVYPPFSSTNLVSFVVCNPTASSITPASLTIFWDVK